MHEISVESGDLSRELADTYLFSIDSVEALREVYEDDVEKVIQSLKRPDQRYFLRVNTLKTSPEELINKIRTKSNQIYLFDPIEEAAFTPIRGPFEIPKVTKRIIIDKFAAESVLQGAHVYAPAVVNCSKLRRNDEVEITDVYDQVVGVGRMQMSETEILKSRRGLAVKVTSPIYTTMNLRESEEYSEGLFYPQSLPAMVTSRVLDPKPGDTIVDLNCSPGGKLSHISQLMQNKGKLIGVDRNPRKVRIARENIERLGCQNVTLISHDSRYLDVDYPGLTADKCLVDPPCSALGLNPKLHVEISRRAIQDLSSYQKQFLSAASRLVKDRGSIVYSVCTITKQECEDVARYGIEELGLRLTDQKIRLGGEGMKSFGDAASSLQRFNPDLHSTGYFIANFTKS
jgi:predicted RNA-binding protein (TIGR00451 family)